MDVQKFSRLLAVTCCIFQVVSAQFDNPCTNDALSTGRFYHAFPTDPTKYIQCEEWGGYHIRSCTTGTWDASAMACMDSGSGGQGGHGNGSPSTDWNDGSQGSNGQNKPQNGDANLWFGGQGGSNVGGGANGGSQGAGNGQELPQDGRPEDWFRYLSSLGVNMGNGASSNRDNGQTQTAPRINGGQQTGTASYGQGNSVGLTHSKSAKSHNGNQKSSKSTGNGSQKSGGWTKSTDQNNNGNNGFHNPCVPGVRFLAFPNNPFKYYECVNNYPMEKQCQMNYVWIQMAQECRSLLPSQPHVPPTQPSWPTQPTTRPPWKPPTQPPKQPHQPPTNPPWQPQPPTHPPWQPPTQPQPPTHPPWQPPTQPQPPTHPPWQPRPPTHPPWQPPTQPQPPTHPPWQPQPPTHPPWQPPTQPPKQPPTNPPWQPQPPTHPPWQPPTQPPKQPHQPPTNPPWQPQPPTHPPWQPPTQPPKQPHQPDWSQQPTNPTNPPNTFCQNSDSFYHPYPPDETRFVQCDAFGNMYLRYCGPNKKWDNSHKTCIGNQNFDDTDHVGGGEKSINEQDFSYLWSSSNNGQQNGQSVGHPNPENVIGKINTDDTPEPFLCPDNSQWKDDLVTCVGEGGSQPQPTDCPEGMVWLQAVHGCLNLEAGMSLFNSLTPISCPETHTYNADTGHCEETVAPPTGTGGSDAGNQALECQGDYEWDDHLQMCVKKLTAEMFLNVLEVDGSEVTGENGVDSNNNGQGGQNGDGGMMPVHIDHSVNAGVSLPNGENPCLTSNEWYHDYPGDPRYFIQCDPSGRMYVQPCEYRLVWHKALKSCVPWSVLLSTPKLNGESENMAGAAKETRSEPLKNPCINSDRTFHKFPLNKRIYLMCVESMPYMMPCPVGLEWDQEVETCMPSEMVDEEPKEEEVVEPVEDVEMLGR